VTLEQHIFNFIKEPKHSAHYSEKTLSSYKLDLLKFLTFTNNTKEDPTTLTKRTCRQYLYFLEQEQLSRSSIHRHISSLRRFWSYLIEKKVVQTNPWQQLTLPKLTKSLPDFLSTDEMISFLDNIDTSTAAGQRDRMICEFLYATGVRVSELANMNLNDLNLSENEARILGKRNKERIVIFADITTMYIRHYLTHCRSKWKTTQTDDAFLINQKGQRLSIRSIQRIIKHCASIQGLEKKITPHTLRHSFATDLFNGGADLSSVQELLGHSNVATTEIYTHVSEKTLFSSFHKAHPHGNKNQDT